MLQFFFFFTANNTLILRIKDRLKREGVLFRIHLDNGTRNDFYRWILCIFMYIYIKKKKKNNKKENNTHLESIRNEIESSLSNLDLIPPRLEGSSQKIEPPMVASFNIKNYLEKRRWP